MHYTHNFPHEIVWLEARIAELETMLGRKPSVSRQITDLKRQIRERELALTFHGF
jgi:hypothetical protein